MDKFAFWSDTWKTWIKIDPESISRDLIDNKKIRVAVWRAEGWKEICKEIFE